MANGSVVTTKTTIRTVQKDIMLKTQTVQAAAKAYNTAMVALQGVTGGALAQVEEDLKVLNEYKTSLENVSKGMNLIVPVPVIPNFK